VRYVLIFACPRFTAWHSDKYPCFTLDDFHVVDYKTLIERHGHIALELPLAGNLPDADIRVNVILICR